MHQYTRQENLEYFIGLICLFLGVGTLGFCLYIAPHALFGLDYSVPLFVTKIRTYLQVEHGIRGIVEMLVLFIPLIIAGLVFLYLAKQLTVDLEVKESHLDLDQPGYYPPSMAEEKPIRRYKVHPLIVNLAVILLVLVLLLLAEWLLLGVFT